jgi:DNA-binding transcriptional LysR family regulator
LEREPLFEDRLVAILTSQLTLANILRESLVLLAPGYCTRELVDQNIRALGLDRSVKPAIEMNSIEGVLTTVQQTNMITLLPNAAVQWKNYPDLRVVPLADALHEHYSAHSFQADRITNFLENGGSLEAPDASRTRGHSHDQTL